MTNREPFGPDSAKLARGRELWRWSGWNWTDTKGPITTPPVATIPEGCPYPLFERDRYGMMPW